MRLNHSESIRAPHPVNFKRYAWIIASVWSALIGILLTLDIRQVKRNILEQAKAEARVALIKDIAYRDWATSHGGIYVPVTKTNLPNPFLAHVPERDITTPSGRLLTLVNPAWMVRQVHDRGRYFYGQKGHVTSLNPIRLENAPDAWETLALRSFAQGGKEYSATVVLDGKPHLRMMQPLYLEKGCQRCHVEQRYRQGDVRGGISGSIPLESHLLAERNHTRSMVAGYGAVWVLGLFGIGFVAHRLQQHTSERERAVEERREIVERYQAILQTAMEGFWMVDMQGRLLEVNEAYCRMSGYSTQELLAMSISCLEVVETPDDTATRIRRIVAQGENRFESRHRRKDGTIFDVDVGVQYRPTEGGRLVAFLRDITEAKEAEEKRRNLENQLRVSQKMEAVGTLAGGVAHDFNNSLTGIVGFVGLLRLRMAGDEKVLHDLDAIQHCSERAAKLTRQLLTFARRQVIEPVNLNLSALIADLMNLVGKVVGEHIEVKTSLEKNVPTVCADPGQIEQVIMNLCLNARDAMPEGGRLLVETGDVVLEEEDVRRNQYMIVGRYALLTVSDTGVGMDEKTRERVFEPFFTTKGPDKGTGLGLAMVYGIVKQHGGFIHLHSEPGKGTAFKVYFPAIDAQPEAVPTIGREEAVRGGTETILLAEDEESIRALAERILTGFGYTVLVARNGEEAIEVSDRNVNVDLAVLDVVMPRKGGKEAYEEMRRKKPKLKVIFMSGYFANAVHNSFVLIPGTPLLQKPFGPTILARKVREVLDGK